MRTVRHSVRMSDCDALQFTASVRSKRSERGGCRTGQCATHREESAMDSTELTGMMAAKNECHSKVIDLPGVFATSVGFRHIAGVMTNEVSICVHVMKKMPLRDLARAARIPISIDGLHIDVVEGRPPRLAGDKERPLRGGIEVSGYGIHYGTLG